MRFHHEPRSQFQVRFLRATGTKDTSNYPYQGFIGIGDVENETGMARTS